MDYKIYSVHGTFAADTSQRGHRWWQKESSFSDAVLSYLDTKTYRVTWEPIRWSGDNKSSERGEAAQALAEVLSKIEHSSTKVALLAHSHGGNIVYSARDLAKRKNKIPELPVVTVGTPFIHEIHSSSWQFEKLRELWLVSVIVFIVCLSGLWFSEEGTLVSKVLAIFSLIAVGGCALSLYFKISMASMWRGITRKSWMFRFLFFLFFKFDDTTRKKNLKDPKIYSLNDEAINALKAVPSQEIKLVSTEIALLPAAIAFAVVLFLAEVLFLPQIVAVFPGDIIEDYRAIFSAINSERLLWFNDVCRLVILFSLSIVIGVLCSRLFLAGQAAKIFNKFFSRTIKERAYGWDNEINSGFPMITSANLPLMFKTYKANEKWRPVPKSVDDDLDRITAESTTGMFRAIRETLGMGLTTGSYTFSEAVSTNFRGDELVHSAYFNHPHLPGFLAWILCEFYGFPKGSNYSSLPVDKFQSWWDDIRPDSWSSPTEKSTETSDQE